MRDIKFRGKRIDNGEWVYGFLIQYENGLFICNFVGDAYQYHVDPETVGQYTGLKDKNGIPIYEGDTFPPSTRTNGDITIVCYDSAHAMYKAVPLRY